MSEFFKLRNISEIFKSITWIFLRIQSDSNISYSKFWILNFEFWILLLIEIDWIFDIEFSEILKKTIFIFFSHDTFKNPTQFGNSKFFRFWIWLLIEWIFQASKFLWNLEKTNIYHICDNYMDIFENPIRVSVIQNFVNFEYDN